MKSQDSVISNIGTSRLPGGESAIKRIFDVHDIKVTNVLLTVNNYTSTAHVTTTSDHDNVASVEFHEVGDLSCLQVQLDSIVGLNGGVGVADGTSVVGDNMGDTAGTDCDFTDFAELVRSLFRGYAMDGETTLHIVQEAEVFTRLFNGNDV